MGPTAVVEVRGLTKRFGDVVALDDVAHLGANVHLLVRIPTDRRFIVIEKNLGQSLERKGEAIALRFGPQDCIIVRAEKQSLAAPRAVVPTARRPAKDGAHTPGGELGQCS